MKTSWNFNQAEWRDVPKTILRLDMNGKTIVKTDENWKVLPSSAVYFNVRRMFRRCFFPSSIPEPYFYIHQNST